MEHNAEQRLVHAARAGDHGSFEKLIHLYGGAVLGIAYSRVHNFAVAEDISQDAFVLSYQQLATLRRPERFGAWLRAITRNLCNHWQRRERYRHELAADAITVHECLGYTTAPGPLEQLEREELKSLLASALSTLSQPDQEALLTFYFEGRSLVEAAQAAGVRSEVMRKRVQRARERLRVKLDAELEEGLVNAGRQNRLAKRVALALPLGAVLTRSVQAGAVVPGVWAVTASQIASTLTVLSLPWKILGASAVAFLLLLTSVLVLPQTKSPDSKAGGAVAAVEQPTPTVDVAPATIPAQDTARAAEPLPTPSPESPQSIAAVSGTVRNPLGQAVAAARVLVLGPREDALPNSEMPVLAETTSDADGNYAFVSLPPSTDIRLLAYHPSWAVASVQPEDESTALASDEQRKVDITLGPPTEVNGVVVDEEGNPISDAAVGVRSITPLEAYDQERTDKGMYWGLRISGYDLVLDVQTDAQGRFRLTNLPDGWVLGGVRAEKPGFARGYAESSRGAALKNEAFAKGYGTNWSSLCFPPPAGDLRIVLTTPGAVVGVVTDTAGNPIRNAEVVVSAHIESTLGETGTGFQSQSLTDANGAFQIADIPVTRGATVVARHGNDTSKVLSMYVRAGTEAKAHLVLEPASTVSGVLINSNTMEAVADCPVSYFTESASGAIPETKTDSKGQFRITGLPAGTLRLTLFGAYLLDQGKHPEGWSGKPIEVGVGENITGIELFGRPWQDTTSDKPRITGRVFYSDGRAAADALVWLGSRGNLTLRTDFEGRFDMLIGTHAEDTLYALHPEEYLFGSASLQIRSGTDTTIDVVLDQAAARVMGTVLTPEGVKPPVAVRVELSVLDSFGDFLELDEHGVFDSTAVPPGDYYLKVQPGDSAWRPESQGAPRFTLAPGELRDDLHVVLQKMEGFVAGHVRNVDGSPCTNCDVVVGSMVGLARAKTDAEGLFRAEPIDGETVYVSVGEPPQFEFHGKGPWAYIDGIPLNSDDVEITLDPPGMLTGEAVVPEGSEIQLALQLSGALGYERHVGLESGPFRIPLQPDTYDINFRVAGDVQKLGSFIVVSNAEIALGTLAPEVGNASLDILVTCNGGQALPPEWRVEVGLAQLDGAEYDSVPRPTYSDGIHRAKHLFPGMYLVHARVPAGRSVLTAQREITIADNSTNTLELDISYGDCTLEGTVPPRYAGGSITALLEPGNIEVNDGEDFDLRSVSFLAVAMPDETGAFAFDHVPEGSYNLAVFVPQEGVGTDLQRTPVRLKSGEVKRVSLESRS